MAAQYTEVSLKDMEQFLRRAFRSLRPKKGEQRREIYYDLSLSPGVAIRVWTSIGVGRGTGAGVGQDAIRIQLVNKKNQRPLMKGKAPIVKRTQNWRNNLQDRIEDYIEQYEDREDYWEGRVGDPDEEDRPPAPDGVKGRPPSEKQVQYAMFLIGKAPNNFNWSQYGFRVPPDEDGIKSLSARSVSKLIDALRSAKPAGPAGPVSPPSNEPQKVTFTRIGDAWGLKGRGLKEGDIVTVVRKDGRQTKMQVGSIVRTLPDGTTLARIGGARRASVDLEDFEDLEDLEDLEEKYLDTEWDYSVY
jgi:hypothetical protein